MDAQQLHTLLSAIYPVSLPTAEELWTCTHVKHCVRGDLLEKSGDTAVYQFVVIKGIIRKFIFNERGDEFTLDFFSEGEAVTPAIIRSHHAVSFVNLDVISPEAEVLIFDLAGMEQRMASNRDLAAFGHYVLMQDGLARAGKEIIMLAANGVEKLHWFRQQYKNLENRIPHYYIASFLGLTTTSLSRVRKKITAAQG